MAQKKPSTGFSLKDELFNKNRVEYLASLFVESNHDFDSVGFIRDTMKRLRKLELKERIVHIATILDRYLADDYRVAAKQITAALPPPLNPKLSDDDFGDFIFAPLGQFVVDNGLAKEHLKVSLKTLHAITQRFSMEDSIRAFINEHTEATFHELAKWSHDKHYHVRRLVSEGTRPRLPWSGRLSIDCSKPIPLLDTLHADTTRFVTRSVANHLNDISKTDPKIVLRTLRRWRKAKLQDPLELKWLTKHALRTLVKQGNQDALRFLGYHPDPKIEVSNFAIKSKRLKPGDAIEFSFSLTALRNEPMVVDYVIDFVKSNGTLAPKVHKLKQVELKKGESSLIAKRHVLRAGATTYTLYPGTHFLTLQINGKAFGKLPFELR